MHHPDATPPVPRHPAPSARRACRAFAALLLLGAAAGPVRAQDDGLAKNSPFLPPGHNQPKKEAPKPEPVRQQNGPLSRRIEFRGIIEWQQGFQFSIFDKKAKRGYWIEENGAAEGIAIRNFDPDTQSVIVSLDGRSERITLTDASDQPIPVAKSSGGAQANSGNNAPPGLDNNNERSKRRRAVPRRRVVLPRN